MPQWVDALNAKIDQAFELTHLPQLSEQGAGYVGRGFDQLLGTNIAPVVSQIGRDLPRMVTEAALTVPMTASGAGAPATAAMWLNRLRKLGQVVGYADAAVKGTADTGSYMGGAINAATLGLGNKLFLPADRVVPFLGEGLDVGARGAGLAERLAGYSPRAIIPEEGSNLLSRNLIERGAESALDPRTTFQRIMGTTGRATADVGTGVGLAEGARQATLSVGPNAVGPLDPARNPITPENIAGNVVNALPMAVAATVAGRARFEPAQVKNLQKWIENRKAAEATQFGFDWEGPVTAEQYHDVFGTLEGAPAFRGQDLVPTEDYWTPENLGLEPFERTVTTEQKNVVRVAEALRTHIEILKDREARGDPEAEMTRRQIKDILDGTSVGLDSAEGIISLKKTLAEYDATARQMPPTDAKGFVKFVQDLNDTIDQLNENTVSFEEGQKTKEQMGKTWHPNARSSLVTDRLQNRGVMEKITPEWLKREFNAEFDQSGDPQFAYQVVLQKAANRVLDGVPAALEKERSLPPAASPVSTKVGAIDAFEAKYIDALKSLPEDVARPILERSVEIRRRPTITAQGGKLLHVETAWRKAIIRAMESYDPTTQTILLRKGDKFGRSSIRDLFLRDENGDYVYQPNYGSVRLGEGGKASVEGSLADRSQFRSVDEAFDEELFKTTLAEEGVERVPGVVLREGELPTKVGVPTGEEQIPEVGSITPDFLKDKEGKTVSMADKKDTILKTISSLSDEQLNAVASAAFAQKPRVTVIEGRTIETPVADRSAGMRKKLMRTALLAQLEDTMAPQGTPVGENGRKFLQQWHETNAPIGKTEKVQLSEALRRFWGHQTEVNFKGAVQGVRPDQQRLAYVVTRLLDPEVVNAVKGLPKLSGPETGQVGDVLTNTQPEGAFVGDVYRTFRTRFDQILGQRGYSGTYRDLLTEMAVAIAQQAPDRMTDFYRIAAQTQGLASDKVGRAKVGVNVDKPVGTGAEIGYVNLLLSTLAHELSHIDTFILNGLIDAPDAFSERRRIHAQNLRELASITTVEERVAMLTTLKDGLVPKRFQSLSIDKKTGLIYGAHDPEEFVATINELIAASLLHGKKSGFKKALEVLDYGPVEVREYAQGTYRAISDVLQGMKDSLTDPTVREMMGKSALPETDTFVTSSLFGAVVDAAREASLLRDSDRALAQSRAFIASASQGAGANPPALTPAMWFRTAKDIDEGYRHTALRPDPRLMPAAVEGINDASDFISKKVYDKVHRPGVWASWFYPFTHLMESMQRSGFELGRPVANLAMGMESAVSRLRSGILEPFVIKGKDGKVQWDNDNVLIKRISEGRSGPWRDAFNRLSAWQQENAAQSIFLQDKDGRIVVNTDLKGAAQEWESVRKRLTPEDQQVVMSSMVATDRAGQNGALTISKALDESNVHRTARTFMAMNRKMTYEQALDLAQQTVVAYLSKNELALQQLLPVPQQRQAFDILLAGPEGLLAKTMEVTDKLQSRPGYRPESLPDDWILRYQTPDGEIRYASAKSEFKANWKMRELKKEGMVQAGEIVRKEELREFTDFDDPDTLLRKFAEVETAQWNRFVGEIEKTHGTAVADDLRGYVPGEKVMKELATQGLNRWLVERKNAIDRERFDYIDSTMAWAGRLAASVAFRQTRQMKDLILADPRARMFPSFEKLVNDHFENMMSPTSQWSKELRSFSTAMMMGGSLASTLINASQSVVSLVPILIQYDKVGMGPVGAWKAMTKAIADASAVTVSKNWQAVAAAAERVDSAKWTLEEAKAALYKRNVEDGGINHGIILDNIFSSTDQKTVLQAKFGHGNYGPVTVGELVRSPVFLASQLSLKPFGWVEQMNNKISLMAGVEQGYRQGLRGDALYEHAKLVKTLSTYGGGKANAPGLVPKLSTPYTRSAVGVVNNLQQYGYGIVATYAQLVKDALGQSHGLTPLERRQAVKAFGTMLATQTAIGGALGLPFAAATLTAIEKVFGIPANQLVREGLASLGSDEESGATIAETALNGIGNQMFGIDVSSRLGVSNLLGTSAYRGFNLSDMAGPTGSIIGNAVDALNLFATGQPLKAAKELVPNSFRNLVALTESKAKYGDLGMRDSSERLLYQPTTSQAAWYLAGFRPRELSQKRQAQGMLTLANERATKARGRDLDEAGRSLLAGDPSEALMYAQNLRYGDPTVNPQAILHQIVSRAVDSTTERDLLASGPTSNEQERQRIAATFGQGVVTRQSEIQRAQLGAQLGMQVGLAPDPKAFQRAALVDSLVQSQGMPRSQAVRLAEFLQ